LSLIATASEIVFWNVYNVQNLHFSELMTYNLFVYAIHNGENQLDDWFVHFILPRAHFLVHYLARLLTLTILRALRLGC
jgi:hypothetical protein